MVLREQKQLKIQLSSRASVPISQGFGPILLVDWLVDCGGPISINLGNLHNLTWLYLIWKMPREKHVKTQNLRSNHVTLILLTWFLAIRSTSCCEIDRLTTRNVSTKWYQLMTKMPAPGDTSSGLIIRSARIHPWVCHDYSSEASHGHVVKNNRYFIYESVSMMQVTETPIGLATKLAATEEW
jgi:hypothetical protein